jgi:hypothetical protein
MVMQTRSLAIFVIKNKFEMLKRSDNGRPLS